MKFKRNKGFTLIEFVVIISIFAIMAGVALVNFAGFKSNVGLNNLAHDIALTVRQAQVFGWATQTDNTGGAIQFVGQSEDGDPIRYADGVYFNSTAGVFDKWFTLYTKTIPDLHYEYYLPTDREVDKIQIQGPNHISGIYYADSKTALELGVGNTIPTGNTPIESLSIAFSRPHPEAIFFDGGSNLSLLGPQATYVGIYISADTDAPGVAQHVITISRFGEIAVQ